MHPMGRASIIVFVYIAPSVLLLLLLLSPSEIPTARHSHRRLQQFPSTSEELFRRGDEDVSHMTPRPAEEFPMVDVDCADRILRPERIRQNLRHAGREMHLCDENQDGFVSFSEYYPPSRLQNAGNYYYGYDDMEWWKEERFNVSDADGDGRLNLTEFNDFLHPADSQNPKLLQWLCKQEVRERDTDRDGKISFEEFYLGLFDLARKYDEESTQRYEGSRDAPARALFAQLDKDGDGYLSHHELLPVIGKIHPSEHYYAKQQADYIISQDDADKDGRRTLTDIIKKPYQFYRGMYNEYEDEYDSHDESYKGSSPIRVYKLSLLCASYFFPTSVDTLLQDTQGRLAPF